MGAVLVIPFCQTLHILYIIGKFPLLYGRLQKAAAIPRKLAVMDFFRSMVYKITHYCFPPIKKAEKTPHNDERNLPGFASGSIVRGI